MYNYTVAAGQIGTLQDGLLCAFPRCSNFLNKQGFSLRSIHGNHIIRKGIHLTLFSSEKRWVLKKQMLLPVNRMCQWIRRQWSGCGTTRENTVAQLRLNFREATNKF